MRAVSERASERGVDGMGVILYYFIFNLIILSHLCMTPCPTLSISSHFDLLQQVTKTPTTTSTTTRIRGSRHDQLVIRRKRTIAHRLQTKVNATNTPHHAANPSLPPPVRPDHPLQTPRPISPHSNHPLPRHFHTHCQPPLDTIHSHPIPIIPPLLALSLRLALPLVPAHASPISNHGSVLPAIAEEEKEEARVPQPS